MIHGVILTQCNTLDNIAASIQRGGYNALKVVTGWGYEWSKANIQRVAWLTPNLIIRTVAGDPSYNNGSHSYPEVNRILAEISTWHLIRSDIYVEIGNEPNVRTNWKIDDAPEGFVWEYRWHLLNTIKHVRAVFPRVRIIAPAALLEPSKKPDRWLELMADAMKQCDFIGVHAYEYDAFLASERRKGSTGQLQMLRDLHLRHFADKDWLLTEYGINDPPLSAATKGKRYAALLKGKGSPALPKQVVGGLMFHYCDMTDNYPEYRVTPELDVAYKREWERK